MWKLDYERNTLRALQKGVPERPALFELFLNTDFYERLAGRKFDDHSELGELRLVVEAMAAAGYDYAVSHGSEFLFSRNDQAQANTISLNEGFVITDWESFEKYKWNDPFDYDTSALKEIDKYLPEGMKIMIMCPGGVMEILISLIGYDNLCIMLFEEPELVQAVADKIGQTLIRFYESVIDYDSVGFLSSNDDWGFNTQTFLSPADMRKYVFPWHKKVVELAHKKGKPCILHSCGYYDEIIEDVITDMKFDGRHSYEDNICPVEAAYEKLNGRIAVMGGIDMDFMVRSTPEKIFERATAMLDRTQKRGGYLLGTGNSVPEYIPFENYMALLRAGWEYARG